MKFLGAIALAGLFLLPNFVWAACVSKGTTVVYVNGIFTTEAQARADAKNLNVEFARLTGDRSVNFINGYNPSHIAGLGDVTQAAAQALDSSISSYDLNTILLQIHPQVTTRKLLLVGHSQGSFYANDMYSYLLAHGEPKAAVGVYHVGSPASFVAGGGKYLTSSNDSIINAARLIASNASQGLIPLAAATTAPKQKPVLPANIALSTKDYGHLFSSVYLAEAPERVVGDIQSSLSKLKPEVASETGECFTPPTKNLGYQAASVGYAVADTAAAGVKTGLGAAQVVAVKLGNGLASAAQGAYSLTTKVVSDVKTTVGGAAGITNAPEAKSTNFDIIKKLYGSSLTKEEYEEYLQDLGGAVASAPVVRVEPQEEGGVLTQIKKIIYLGGKSKSKDTQAESVPEPIEPALVEPVPPGDTTPPVIEHIDDFSNEVSPDDVAMWYGVPGALDDTDGVVEATCTPEPGSIFDEGTTTVMCTAHDTAGNTATSSFAIGVVVVPNPVLGVIAAQDDMSHLCDDPVWVGWRNCFVGPETSVYSVNLGNGLEGTVDSLTIAKDTAYGEFNLFHPWLITIECFIDSGYSEPCTDWVMPGPAAPSAGAVAKEAAESSDGTFWTAYFMYDEGRDINREYPLAADGSAPIFFNPAHYYRLSIDDQEWSTGLYGSATEPYWVLRGWH